MLSPRLDDDDDSHLCIKCNATIVGLENYIKHRKNRCNKNKVETAKPDIPNIGALDPTYSLGADVFFQSLELQSSVKKAALSRLTPPIPVSKSSSERKTTLLSRDVPRMSPLDNNLRGEDWIGGHSLKISTSEDNQIKLINAVASISGGSKKDIPGPSYRIETYDYKADEESDESEETDEDDEDEPVESGGKWKPSPNYTGGKWRPASPDHEDWDAIINDQNEEDYDADAPPPSHTKGKWIPGMHEKTQIMQPLIQTKGSVQYWCGPCNRRLGSRAIYEKHLMSNLHMKKVLPEHELEYAGNLEPTKVALERRTIRASRYIDEDSKADKPKKRQRTIKPNILKVDRKKRKRRPYFLKCSGCKSRVRVHLMGKHLMSHYHFRKATGAQSDVYQQLILSNIDAIVHQSPFQCSPCKFYTNWLSTFMQHWHSEEHQNKIDSMDGKLWCSFCKFECDSSQDMLTHMSGAEHNEVIAVINRSMPIIIRKKSVIKCSSCSQEFRYNIEMKRHCQKTGHDLFPTATDRYQETHICKFCKTKFKTSKHLAAHLKSKHKLKNYVCLVCDLKFENSIQVKQHRISTEHRVKRKEKKAELGVTVKDMSRKCPYCTEKVILKNILVLKEHITNYHPNIKKKCPKCGMGFTLSQEVSRHVRNNACKFPTTPDTSTFWNCSQCPFTTDSQAECFFHEILHTTPEIEFKKVGDLEKKIEKYTCPLCPKIYKKASLRHHLRQHTFERPFVCSTCGSNFTRQSSLANHIRTVHEATAPSKIDAIPKICKKSIKEDPGTITQEFPCKRCSKKFINRTALTRHAVSCLDVEKLRCTYDRCEYLATSIKQLARHFNIHGEKLKCHACELCPFKSDQISHLKRHMICHEGKKPYVCPHCNFRCGSLENLRKHFLHRKKHSGLYLYNCNICAYHTNQAKELRIHLTNVHSFDSKAAVQTVKYYLIKNVDE